MKKAAATIVLALAAIALVACGGSSETESASTAAGSGVTGESEATEAGGGGSTISLEADPSGGLEYTSDTATAQAGNVKLEFNNPQPLAHDVAIENSNGELVGKTDLTSEGSASATVNLKPGTYTYYCTVPGHREAGMEGTLTVE